MKLTHYLIASEQNDYKPWILSPAAIGIFCFVIWAVRFLVPASLTIAAPGIDPTDLMNKINNERTQRFIPALSLNSKLIVAATGKAADMLARSYFAHIDPDGNYVWPRIEAAGYTPYLTLGENLAMDFTSASDMINAWMNSPTHRANIINEKFGDQGLATTTGLFEANHNTIIAVSLFGALYKSKTSTATAKTVPPPAQLPAPSPLPSPTPSPTLAVTISKDIKITNTSLSGHTLINLDIMITGQPSLATAVLKSQSISLISGKIADEYIGSFTFDQGENLTNQTLTIEARDKNGVKASLDFSVNIESPVPVSQPVTAVIPVSNEAQVIKILRIVFGIFAAIYMAFLVIDAIIIHRAKVNREGIHSWPHLLIFLLIAAVSLLANWF